MIEDRGWLSRSWGRARRGAAVLATALAVAGSVAAVGAAWNALREHPSPATWDVSRHAMKGLELADDIRRARPLAFLSDLNRQTLYPPLHSLMLAAGFVVTGRSDALAGAAVSSLAALLALLFLYRIARDFGPPHAPGARWLVLVFALGSPLFLVFSTLIMKEMISTLFMTASFAGYFRARRSGSERSEWLAGLAIALLLFTKYNYALFFLVTLVLAEWLALQPEQREIVRTRMASFFVKGRVLAPLNLFFVGYLAFLAAIVIGGGFRFEIAGIRVSMTSLGNPLYTLMILAAIRLFFYWRRYRFSWDRVVQRRHRIFFVSILVPAFLWFLIPTPSRVKSLVGHLGSRASAYELLSVETLLYYPRALWDAGEASPVLGAAVLLGLAWALFRLPRFGWPARFVAAFLAIGFVACMVHPFKAERFFVPVLPAVWLLSAWGLGDLAARLGRAAAVALPLAALAAYGASVPELYTSRLPREIRTYHDHAGLEEPLAAVVRLVRTAERPWVFGDFLQMSHHLIDWELLQAGVDLRARPVGYNLPKPNRIGKGGYPMTAEGYRGALRDWLRESDSDAIVTIEVDEGSRFYSRDYRLAQAWKLHYIREIESAPGLLLEQEEQFESLGIRIRLYRWINERKEVSKHGG